MFGPGPGPELEPGRSPGPGQTNYAVRQIKIANAPKYLWSAPIMALSRCANVVAAVNVGRRGGGAKDAYLNAEPYLRNRSHVSN